MGGIPQKLIDYRIGIWQGLGMTNHAIAELAGVHPNTIQNHLRDRLPFINELREITSLGVSRALAQKYAEMEEEFRARRLSLRDRAYKALEEMLDRGELDGLKLATIKEVFDREDGKAVSRIKMDTTRTEVKSIDEDSMAALQALTEEMKQLNQRREPVKVIVQRVLSGEPTEPN